MKKSLAIAAMIFFGSLLPFTLQAQKKDKKTSSKKDTVNTQLLKPQKFVTNGVVTVEGKSIHYKAVAGTLILRNKYHKPTCNMSYTAYFKSGVKDKSKRPITFIYNGGPGSSTMWLHIGAFGPQRAFTKDTQRVMPPYKTVNNDYSLLDVSDLVFIDAPGTGFGRVLTKKRGGVGKTKDFFSIDGDAKAFANFITKFISNNNRWESPKYLFGESYGTFRSAVVASLLERSKNVGLNGVILLSQLLSYANASDGAKRTPGNNLPYQLALPSAAATAWYHHKLPHQPEKLKPFLKKVEHFAMNEYALALNRGSLIDSTTFNDVAQKLHEFTSLPVDYIKKANLRVTGPMYEKMILKKDDKVTGRLDTRFSGWDMDPLSKTPRYDPHSATFANAYIGAFNHYMRTTLKFGQHQNYRATYYSGALRHWKFKHHGGPPNVMNDLAKAMIYNPKLKVMLNMGYFDLGTPFFEGEYEMHHLPIPKALQNNISFYHYFSGHMVYLRIPSLKKLHDNVAQFINNTH